MADKKNDDFVLENMGDDRSEENDTFLARLPRSHNQGPVALTQSFSKLDNSPPLSILAYCLSSISMTIVNKYVVSGNFWNLNFFYLAVQVR
jgi:GDP-mannose transporter